MPRRLRPEILAARFEVSERTAGEWLRAMIAQGVIKKVRAIAIGRLSVVDAWVESGGKVPLRRGSK